ARGRDLDERGQMALAFFESRPRLGIESDDAFLLEVGPGFFQVIGRRHQAYPPLVAPYWQLRHVLAGDGAGDFALQLNGGRGVHGVAPASRRALTTERLSSDSSTKNVTGSSGFEVDFAADRVPDRFFACTVVFRQVRRLVARFETLRKHGGRNAGARDDRPPERN